MDAKTSEGRISIKDVEAEVFQHLLKFIYTGQIGPEIAGSLAEDLWRAAVKYRIPKLTKLCEDRLLESLTVENALVMYDLTANRLESSVLADMSLEMITK